MNCKDCQELILTDYLDNELNKEERGEVDQHLSSCQACREFALNAQAAVMEPFDAAERPEPPESVWHNVKAAIREEQNTEGRISFLDNIKNLIVLPKPALAFAMVVILIVMAKAMINFEQPKAETAKSGIEDITYAMEEIAYLSEDNNIDQPTDIEEYFL
jgi:anti-sigma factor RsiW